MTNIMVDIETLGKSPDGLILSIAAAEFDGEGCHNEFYQNTSIESGMEIGMTISPETVQWWFAQGDQARTALFDPKPLHIDAVLTLFSQWFPKGKKIVWANGAAFDLAILRTAFGLCGIPCPFGWHEEMCMRALRHVGYRMGLDYSTYKKEAGTLHDAREDVRRQARYVSDVLARVDRVGCA